jgi:nucleoside-diphosphate-sugar epimerase
MRRVALDAAPDMALHLGWSMGADCHDSLDNLTCVGGSLAHLQGLVEAPCPRIVIVGTHFELAPSPNDLHEDDPVAPQNLYGACKDAVHRIARAYVAHKPTSFVWVRLFNVYGPGQADWALVSYIIRHLLEGRKCPLTHGEQVRDFLHARDAAEALLDVGHSSVQGVVHVGSGVVMRVRELAQRIGDQLGRSELLRFGELTPRMREAPRIVSSNARLCSEVGRRPRLSLEEGLADTIEWWREHNPEVVAS